MTPAQVLVLNSFSDHADTLLHDLEAINKVCGPLDRKPRMIFVRVNGITLDVSPKATPTLFQEIVDALRRHREAATKALLNAELPAELRPCHPACVLANPIPEIEEDLSNPSVALDSTADEEEEIEFANRHGLSLGRKDTRDLGDE